MVTDTAKEKMASSVCDSLNCR